MPDECAIEITHSRRSTGYLTIGKQFASMFPTEKTNINLLLNGTDAPISKKFAPHTSKTKEIRIYGMKTWYAANGVETGTVVMIVRLSAEDLLYGISVQPGEAGTLTEPTPGLRACDVSEPPPRVRTYVQRIIRDSAKARELKRLYGYKCQICGTALRLNDGAYMIEAHHLIPLGAEHRGLDNHGNMLVLCPNHHALFDFGVPRFLSPHIVEIHGVQYDLALKHPLAKESIDYHNSEIFRPPVTLEVASDA